MKPCPKCQTLHSKPGTFCSRSCANSRGPMSEEQKEYRRQIALERGFCPPSSRGIRNPAKWEERTCPTCLSSFDTLKSWPLKFCSPACVKQGGLRKRSGRGKQGYYKGFFLRSTYELAYVIYCLDHNIDIQPCREFFTYLDPKTNKIRKYFPDFIIDDTIIEIKGYKTYLDNIKLSSVPHLTKILYKKDLAKVFSYVEHKTNLKIPKLYALYESSPPTRY